MTRTSLLRAASAAAAMTAASLATGRARTALQARTPASVSTGARQVTVRVCSSRGVCVELSVGVTTIAPATDRRDDTPADGSRLGCVLDLLIQAARMLLASRVNEGRPDASPREAASGEATGYASVRSPCTAGRERRSESLGRSW